MDITRHVISQAPPTIYYIPNFITENEEEYIINKVNNAPKPKWTQLRNRRLQNWGGSPQPSGMIVEDIPQWLQIFLNKVNDLQLYDKGNLKANHVLINEYLPGQGIMPHVDGPLFYPTILTVTCGSHTILNFQKQLKNDEEIGLDESSKMSLLLERRSVVAVMDSMYTGYLHSIEERNEDKLDNIVLNINKTKFSIGDVLKRDTRISLTIRHVLKTSKIKLNVLFKK
uniref:Putative alkylated dna repair protein n=1 Tax=Panstrongylus megistus TaxID=65343 RepID=A0A069DPT5_9HEMI